MKCEHSLYSKLLVKFYKLIWTPKPNLEWFSELRSVLFEVIFASNYPLDFGPYSAYIGIFSIFSFVSKLLILSSNVNFHNSSSISFDMIYYGFKSELNFTNFIVMIYKVVSPCPRMTTE